MKVVRNGLLMLLKPLENVFFLFGCYRLYSGDVLCYNEIIS